MAEAFSWKRGLQHAAIPCGLVIAAGGMLVATTHPAHPEKLGEATGRLVMVVLLLGLAASYLGQKGRRTGATALWIGVVALIGAAVAAVVLGYREARFDVADRAPLVDVTEGGQRWLRHPTLGFAVRHPGDGFVEAPKFADMMRAADRGDGNVFYAYADAEPSAVLIVSVTISSADSAEALGRTLDDIETGLRESMAKQLTGDATMTVVERRIDPGGRDALLHVAIGEAHVRMHVFAAPDGAVKQYAVTLGVLSKDPGALEAVIAELKR